MTPTQQFIEDAIAGGWEIHYAGCVLSQNTLSKHQINVVVNEFRTDGLDIRHAVLDPLAWQAVGKTRGWKEDSLDNGVGHTVRNDEWLQNWHFFINYLADGKTIDEALAAISN